MGYQLSEDCIQFDLTTALMSEEYNFAEQTYLVDEGDFHAERYYGDSLLCDTLELPLSIIGWESDVPRNFKLRTVPVVDVDTLPMATVLLDSSYSFNADRLVDTIRVVFMRPEAGERLGAGITFDLDGADAVFDGGAEEQSVFELIVSNVYEPGYYWDEAYLGDFSQAKAAFIVTYYQNSLDNLGNQGWSAYNAELREALEEWNATHPDDPMDFTFPVNNKPSWWDMQASSLGEYSEAKNAFITYYLGDYELYMSMSWEWLALYLNYYYENGDYFTENPDAETFLNDFRTVDQQDWWAANEQWLGVFSVPKAMYFEFLYGGSFIWSNGTNYVWKEQMSFLNGSLAGYFSGTTPTPPSFENDFYQDASGAPGWWNSAFLGAYSEEKKAFMESIYDQAGDGKWWEEEAPLMAWGPQIQTLIDMYNRYWPDGKGDFENDFSLTGDYKEDNTPEWWNGAYLGAYSEEKKAFMESIYDQAGDGKWWEEEAPLMAWGPQIQTLIDMYNRYWPDGKGDFENDFSPTGSWVGDDK